MPLFYQHIAGAVVIVVLKEDQLHKMTHFASSSSGEEFVLFYSRHSIFSNHFPVRIIDRNSQVVFKSSEHFYMHSKALFFGDSAAANKIVNCDSPVLAKRIGASTVGYDQAKWDKVSREIMYQVVFEKFKQHTELKIELLKTGTKTIVECSPTDTRWGIGWSVYSPYAVNRSKWRGFNWLGEVLMRVRSELSKTDEEVKEMPCALAPSTSLVAKTSVVNARKRHATKGSQQGLTNASTDLPSIRCRLDGTVSSGVEYGMSGAEKDEKTDEEVEEMPCALAPSTSLVAKKLDLKAETTKNEDQMQTEMNCVDMLDPFHSSSAPIRSRGFNWQEQRFNRLRCFWDNSNIVHPSTNGELLYLHAFSRARSIPFIDTIKRYVCTLNYRVIRRRLWNIVRCLEKKEKSLEVGHIDMLPSFYRQPINISSFCDHVPSRNIVPIMSIPSNLKSSLNSYLKSTAQPLPDTTSFSPTLPFRPCSPIQNKNPPRTTLYKSFQIANSPHSNYSVSTSSAPQLSIRKLHANIKPHQLPVHQLPQSSRPSSSLSSATSKRILGQSMRNARKARDSYHEQLLESNKKVKLLRHALIMAANRSTNDSFALDAEREKVAQLTEKLARARSELRELKSRRSEREANAVVSSLFPVQGGVVATKESGAYPTSFKRTILELNRLGLSDTSVGPAMLKSVRHLTGQSLSDVPSASTVARTVMAAKTLAQRQIKDVLSKHIHAGPSGKQVLNGIELASDETTKWVHKLQTYNSWLADKDGKRRNLVLGVKEVVSKDSETSMMTILALLDEIDKSSSVSQVHASVRGRFRDLVLAHVNSAVGDRAATQIKFADLVKKYREHILPRVRRDWHSMSKSEQYVHKVFITVPCFVHVMASMTAPIIAIFAEQERKVTKSNEVVDANPSVLRVIREQTKHFGPRSSGKYKTFRYYLAWCHSLDEEPVPLPSLKGSRFNVIPVAAARIIGCKDHYMKFMSEFQTEDTVAMRNAMRDELIMAQIHVLALVDLFLSGPMWRISNGEMNILDTPPFIESILEWVDARAADPQSIFMSAPPMMDRVPLIASPFQLSREMAEQVLKKTPNSFALAAGKLAMISVGKFFRRVFAPFLAGGEYYRLCSARGPTAQKARASLAASALNNVRAESTFGLVDWLMNSAPSKRVARVEVETLMRMNDTLKWLDEYPEWKQDEILNECMQMGPAIERAAKKAATQIVENLYTRMQTSEQNDSGISHGKSDTEKATVGLYQSCGFLSSIEDLDKYISRNSDKQIIRSVMSKQLRFRKYILKQSAFSTTCFSLSSRSRDITEEDLVRKVREAIMHDKKLLVHSFCGKPSDEIIGEYEHHLDGTAYPFTVLACMKCGPKSSSFALLQYRCGSEKKMAIVEELFEELLSVKTYCKICGTEDNIGANVGADLTNALHCSDRADEMDAE